MDFIKENMSQTISAKIVKCSSPLYWYANLIGNEYECYEEFDKLLVVDDKDNPHSPKVRMIEKDDCLIRVAELRDGAVQPQHSGLDREQDKIDCPKCGAPLDVNDGAGYTCWSCGNQGIVSLQDEEDL